MKQLSVLFAGLGGVGQRHLRNLRALLGDAVDVSAYRVRRERYAIGDDLQLAGGAGVEERYGVRVHHDLGEALDARPDVVFVTNPTSHHVDVARAAAHRGCHLFVEKPLSHDLQGVDDVVETTAEHGRVGLVAYQLRWHPAFERLRRWLDDGAIGRVLSVRAEVGEYLPGFHPYEDYRRMYASRRALGGGVTLTQIHEIDLLYALFGTPGRVFSMGGKVSDLEVDVEDVACSLMELRVDGRPLFAELHQDYFARPRSRSLTLIGDRGRIEWNLAAGCVVRHDVGGSVEAYDHSTFPRNELFVRELTHFLACVRGEAEPLVTLRDGAETVRIALALLESQASGREVLLGASRAREAA